MKIINNLPIALLLASCSFSSAASDSEATETVRDTSSLCIYNGKINSLGAVIAVEDKLYKCSQVYGDNLSKQTNLVWVRFTRENGVDKILPI